MKTLFITLHAFALSLFALVSVTNVSATDPTVSTLSKPNIDVDPALTWDAMLSRGYTPLFNKQNLNGWRNPYSYGNAAVVDGEIHLTADKKFFLVTQQKFKNFRLSVDIHLPDGPANSGVMFRCHVDPEQQKKVYGYQAECDGSDRRWSGGLYDEARRGWIWPSTAGRSEEQFLKHEQKSKAAFAKPEIRDALHRNGWNRYVITCIDDWITIELNGVQTAKLRDDTDASGYIGIQHHGEKDQTYRFRNLFIKELPVIPATETVELIEQSPVSVRKINETTSLVDFGKVAFGNVAIDVPDSVTISGTVKVHFGEKLQGDRIDRQPPGTVRYGVSEVSRAEASRANTSGATIVPAPIVGRNTEQTNPAGSHPPAVLTPPEWQPVMPFRWVEIEGLTGDLPPESITRRAAFADGWNDDASSFECSDETLNRIWELCKYSIKATTFGGVYVDGDRERIPYEADAYLNQLSHYAVDDDVKMAARTYDWLMENGTWPTEWAPHMVFMAYAEWMNHGDPEWLAERYESLKTKTLLQRAGTDGLVRSDQQDRTKHDIVDWPQAERDDFVFTEINTVVNAFHIEALRGMAEMARAVGKDDEADLFAAQAKLATAAFQEQLFDEEAGVYRDGVGTDHSSVHANFIPLAFDLVPDDKVAGVVDWLRKRDMQCSVYAAQYFLDGLFMHGADDKAIELILADNDRSWKHMIESGTSITWEAWDMKYKPNQDWNHAWGAAPANLLPRHVLGAQPASPAWTTASIRPCTGGLEYARGKVPTPNGPIEIDWKSKEGFDMELRLPDGTDAFVNVPASEGSTQVLVDGTPVRATRVADRWVLSDKVSGNVVVSVK